MLAFLCRDGHFLAIGDSNTVRKLSHDEKSRFSRVDHDAGYDLRTGVGGHGRTESPLLARNDRPLGPADGKSLQRVRAGDGDADGRAQYAPLSRRTEIQRLTF